MERRSRAASADRASTPGLPDLAAAYQRHWDAVHARCLRMLRSPADAEEAAQEVFCRAASHLGAVSDLGAYLATVARHVCCDEMRRRSRQPVAEPDVLEVASTPPLEGDAIARHEVTGLWRLLSPRERSLLAHTFAGFSYEETAERLGVSVRAVAVGLVRARTRARVLGRRAGGWLLAPLLPWRALRRSARLQAAGRGDLSAAGLAGTVMAPLFAGLLFGAQPAASLPLQAARQPGATVAAGGMLASGRQEVAPAARLAPLATGSAPAAPARLPDAPAPPHNPGAVEVPGAPGPLADPQRARMVYVTVSPGYARDHTVFAAGTSGPASVLFRTADGGSSWQALASAGFGDGRVLLPPGYPDDPIILVSSATGLLESDDGGILFRDVVPYLEGGAAIDPASPRGDPRVTVAASGKTWTYRPRAGTLLAGPPLPSSGAVLDMRVVSGGRVVALLAPPMLGSGTWQVATCDALACTTALSSTAPLELMARNDGSDLDDVAVFSPVQSVLEVSHDGARSFTRAALPDDVNLNTVTLTPGAAGGPPVVRAAGMLHGDALHIRLFESHDGGASFSERALPFEGMYNYVVLPDGRILATLNGLDQDAQVGTSCSSDGGVTWRRTC